MSASESGWNIPNWRYRHVPVVVDVSIMDFCLTLTSFGQATIRMHCNASICSGALPISFQPSVWRHISVLHPIIRLSVPSRWSIVLTWRWADVWAWRYNPRTWRMMRKNCVVKRLPGTRKFVRWFRWGTYTACFLLTTSWGQLPWCTFRRKKTRRYSIGGSWSTLWTNTCHG